jgi:hypothetical protein
MGYNEDRIVKIKSIIIEIENAIEALIIGNHQSYELDTGQGKQRVTRLDLATLKSAYKEYLELLNELESGSEQAESSSTVQMRPRW